MGLGACDRTSQIPGCTALLAKRIAVLCHDSDDFMYFVRMGLSQELTRALGLAILTAVHAYALPACGAISQALVASAACLVDPSTVLGRRGDGDRGDARDGGAPALAVHLCALVTVRLGCILKKVSKSASRSQLAKI